MLYYLNENMSDFDTIGRFMTRVLSPVRKLRWMRLDNAAKIYPAAKRRNWTNYFRLSATLTEEVDLNVLRAALDVTVRRFRPSPSACVGARSGTISRRSRRLPRLKKTRAIRLSTSRLTTCANAPSACWSTAAASP